MKGYYKGVLCNLGTYRVMSENKPALYYIDSSNQETMLKAGFVDVQACLWVKILTDEEYNDITHISIKYTTSNLGERIKCLLKIFLKKLTNMVNL